METKAAYLTEDRMRDALKLWYVTVGICTVVVDKSAALDNLVASQVTATSNLLCSIHARLVWTRRVGSFRGLRVIAPNFQLGGFVIGVSMYDVDQVRVLSCCIR